MHLLHITIVIILMTRLQLVNGRRELIIRDSIAALYLNSICISLFAFLHLTIESLLDFNQMLQNVLHLVFEFNGELLHWLLIFLDLSGPWGWLVLHFSSRAFEVNRHGELVMRLYMLSNTALGSLYLNQVIGWCIIFNQTLVLQLLQQLGMLILDLEESFELLACDL